MVTIWHAKENKKGQASGETSQTEKTTDKKFSSPSD